VRRRAGWRWLCSRDGAGFRPGPGLGLALAALSACVLVLPALAQTPAQQSVLDGIANQYRDASRLWRPRLIPIAQQLFLLLAGLEFAVSGALWALRRDSLDDIAAKFLLKFALVAFLLALITSFTYWIPPIVNGFAVAGERAIGATATVSPSGIIDIGRQTALTVMNTLDLGAMLKNPAMAVFGALAALIIALAYILIAGQLVLVLIESYVVLGAGVLFLGFAAFRGTAAFAENLIAYTFGVGIKVFFLYLIVGLGSQIAKSWIPLLQTSTFFGPTSPLLEVMGGAIIFAALAWRVPTVVALRLSGSASFGIAHALRALS
jgi:type IV secretion system protein TrbL